MSMIHSVDGYACCSDESSQCWIYCFCGMPFLPSMNISSWPDTSWWQCWLVYGRKVSSANDYVLCGKFQFILFLHAVLHSDYTTGLSYLMKYPSNIDVMSIIRHSLHLYAPEVWNFHFLCDMMCGCELRRRRLKIKRKKKSKLKHWLGCVITGSLLVSRPLSLFLIFIMTYHSLWFLFQNNFRFEYFCDCRHSKVQQMNLPISRRSICCRTVRNWHWPMKNQHHYHAICTPRQCLEHRHVNHMVSRTHWTVERE